MIFKNKILNYITVYLRDDSLIHYRISQISRSIKKEVSKSYTFKDFRVRHGQSHKIEQQVERLEQNLTAHENDLRGLQETFNTNEQIWDLIYPSARQK